MKKVNYILAIIVLLQFAGLQLFSQEFSFRTFGPESALSNKYIYKINQGSDGYLWLGSGEGVFRYNGFSFVNEFAGDTLPKRIVVSSLRDSKNRVWFGYRDGAIAVLEGMHFKLLTIDEDQKSSVNGFIETGSGKVIAALQDKGLLIVDEDFSVSYLTDGLEGQLISSVYLISDENLLIGTFDGLSLYHMDIIANKISLAGQVKDIPNTRIQSIVKTSSEGDYLVGTDTDGAYQLHISGSDVNSSFAKQLGAEEGLKYSNVLDLYQDHEKNIWVCTNGEGVFRFLPGNNDSLFSGVQHFGSENGLPSDYIADVYEDTEGNLWFATIGEGLTVLKDQSFTFYNFESINFNDNILSLCSDDDRYYLGGETGILVTGKSGNKADYYLDKSNGLPQDKITCLYNDHLGYIWIGTSRSGIYRMKAGSRKAELVYFSTNSIENIINVIRGDGKSLWIGTYGGVINMNTSGTIIKKYTTDQRLPHNKIQDIFIDSKSNVWIASRSNHLFCITTGQEFGIETRSEMDFVSIVEDRNGQLWGATYGFGVFHFLNPDSADNYTSASGLLSDYCYSLSLDRNGNVWVGHSAGLSRIEIAEKRVLTYSVDQGITANCNYNATLTNSRQNLLIGTSKGLIEYDPSKERVNLSPPSLNISSVKIQDVDYDFSNDIKLKYGKYKVRIDFIGINLKTPEDVYYQYKLDGYDDWSEPSNIPYVIYSRVEDGDYTFMLRACTTSEICTETPLELKISVHIPVWKAWWFIVLVILSIIGIVYAIIKYREKKQKQIQEYLETELDLRTKEVMEQAEEIENKNRDITDSINYAQRIQASILPPIKRLHDTFGGSFVFYQPRDIVSGDFYWFDKVWDDKFVIVCADSTGHGVPGAFMSMIGTTLIKDICNRPGVRSPSQILKTLDLEIMTAMNQNVEAEKSTDGMDIIVAEIDLRTNYLRVSSAMRPLIIYVGGEQVYVKGSRFAVGGHYEQDAETKDFQDEGFQLSRGDLIYMFSDGYPDQFGGPLGKKFKMIRLKNLLHDIHDKAIEEQHKYVKSNFNLWKEDLEQVDDVLFMGLKI